MKVLVISHNSFSNKSNNGKTLESIFSAFPKKSLMQLYFHDGELPDFSYADNYFKITDKDVFKVLFGRQQNCGGRVTNEPALNKSQTLTRVLFSNNLKIYFQIIRDFIWGITRTKDRFLYKWIFENKPEVIFFTGGDALFIHKIATKISIDFQLPMFTYLTDDYIIYPKSGGIIGGIRRKSLIRVFSKTISQSSLCFAIGDKMADEYGAYFKRHFEPIMNSVSFKPLKNYQLEMPIIISYFGGLHLNRWMTITKFSEILLQVEHEHQFKFILNVYTAQKPNLKILKKFEKFNVNYCGFVNSAEMSEKIKNSSFLLHVESDHELYKSLTRLSVSTKIPEYLISSKPIIAYGPSELASIELIKNNEIGIVLPTSDDKNMLVGTLSKFLLDQEMLKNVVIKGYNYALTNFNKKFVSEKIYSLMKETKEKKHENFR